MGPKGTMEQMAISLLKVVASVATVLMTAGSAVASGSSATTSRCEFQFSLEQPIVTELAKLRATVDREQSEGDPARAILLYNSLTAKFKQAQRDGIDTRWMNVIAEELKIESAANDEIKRERTERTRSAEQRSLVIDGSKIVLNPIAPGPFTVIHFNIPQHIEVSEPFQMAATLTTQIVWRKIIESAKKSFPGKYDSLRADPAKFKGDLLPVESVSPVEIESWIEALNELAQIKHPIVSELLPDHQDGDHYRLPKEVEWKFVELVRGQFRDGYFNSLSKDEKKRFAWFRENSDAHTHPVATKEGMNVDGMLFYDLHGNVAEWTHERINGSAGGVEDANGRDRWVCGGSLYSNLVDIGSNRQGYMTDRQTSESVGFRLAKIHP
jgi:formylglycine-generating enzyme required for sulfatase activity